MAWTKAPLFVLFDLIAHLAWAQEGRVTVDFPPGLPSTENIHEVCLLGQSRPRYPHSELPNHAYLWRQVDAIHRVEAWYNQTCCQDSWERNVEQAVCCAKQAWKKALSLMCEEEAGTKTKRNPCCQLRGPSRWVCFASRAPNPSYNATTPYTGPDVQPRGPPFTFPAGCSMKQ